MPARRIRRDSARSGRAPVRQRDRILGRLARRSLVVLAYVGLVLLGLFGIVFSFSNYPLLASGVGLLVLVGIGYAERGRAKARRERDRARQRRLS